MVPSSTRAPARAASHPRAAGSQGRRRWLVAVAGLLVAGAGAGWWLLRPAGDRVTETLALQRELLAAGAASVRRADVDRIIRNVDHMSRDEIKQVRAALVKEWREMVREKARRYVMAPADKRPGLIDADLASWVTFRELLSAATPGADPRQARRSGKPRPAATPGRGRPGPEEQYVAAIVARAKARGLPPLDFR